MQPARISPRGPSGTPAALGPGRCRGAGWKPHCDSSVDTRRSSGSSFTQRFQKRCLGALRLQVVFRVVPRWRLPLVGNPEKILTGIREFEIRPGGHPGPG